MRLRTNVNAPARFEDEADLYTSSAKDPTKPFFPRLLKNGIIPYDSKLPPAAFPTVSDRQSLTVPPPEMPQGNQHNSSTKIDLTSGNIYLPILRRGEMG